MQWTLPNILTVARLLAAPMFALVFVLLPRPLADLIALVLFVGAALTDYVDGYLARKWGQVSRFGAMLDPIADKAMVVIALTVLLALSGLSILVLIPTTVILFREVFVSGLREFLGTDAGKLAVTKLAKWKTTVQMVAVAMLLVTTALQTQFEAIYYTMDPSEFEAVLSGVGEDPRGLRPISQAYSIAQVAGLALLWLAAVLTLITGLDYFRKALPYLREAEE